MKNDPYLLSGDEENSVFFQAALQATLNLAASANTEKPYTPAQQKLIRDSAKIALGIVDFTDLETLKKDWADVDWKSQSLITALSIVMAANKDVYRACQIDWVGLQNPKYSEQDVFYGYTSNNRRQEEKLWLVDTLFAGTYRDVFTEITCKQTRKVSLAGMRSDEVLWEMLFEQNMLTMDTELDSSLFSEPSKLRMYDLAIAYGHDDFLKKNPPSKTIKTRAHAETALMCVLKNASGGFMRIDQPDKIITACLKKNPDLSRQMKEKKIVLQSIKDGTGVVSAGLSVLLLDYAVAQKHTKIKNHLLQWVQTASPDAQQEFVQGLLNHSVEIALFFAPFLKDRSKEDHADLVKHVAVNAMATRHGSVDSIKDLLSICQKSEGFFGPEDLAKFAKVFFQSSRNGRIDVNIFRDSEILDLFSKNFEAPLKENCEAVFDFLKNSKFKPNRSLALAEKNESDKEELSFSILVEDIKNSRARQSRPKNKM